jgi:predicted dehydrogenase
MKVLILGYGRAGKRWAQICLNRDYTVMIYDPVIESYPIPILPVAGNLDTFELDLLVSLIDFAIICTPPDKHLDNIEALLNIGITDILCEKPLCSIGEIERAREVLSKQDIMVAYNYVYHPSLYEIENSDDFYQLDCSQHRRLPEWGLLLDHCSHDLDIARKLLGKSIRVTYAYNQSSSGIERWFIGLINDNEQNFFVEESVYLARKVPRIAILESRNTGDIVKSTIQLDPDPKMFEDMLDAFLSGTRNLDSALITQRLLEETHAKASLESST